MKAPKVVGKISLEERYPETPSSEVVAAAVERMQKEDKELKIQQTINNLKAISQYERDKVEFLRAVRRQEAAYKKHLNDLQKFRSEFEKDGDFEAWRKKKTESFRELNNSF